MKRIHMNSFWLGMFIANLVLSCLFALIEPSSWFLFPIGVSAFWVWDSWRKLQASPDSLIFTIRWDGDKISSIAQEDGNGNVIRVLAEDGKPPEKMS